MNFAKVMLIVPNPRTMSLVSPIVSLFYSIFKKNGIDMKFFDTTFYDMSERYTDPNIVKETILGVKPVGKRSVTELLDGNRVEKDFKDNVKEYNPDVIMASVMESAVHFTRDLLKYTDDLNVKQIMGGVFPTFAPEVAINFDEIDAICVGEGENVIVPLVKKIKQGESIAKMPNMWVKENGEIIKGELLPPTDINKNPPFDVVPYDDSRFYRPMSGKIYRMFPVETHRGCIYDCAFCNSPLQKKKFGIAYFRHKTIENVMIDIKYFVKCKAEYLFFWDDNFFLYSMEDFEKFCSYYEKIRIPFYVQSHPKNLDEEKIKMLKEVGMHRVGIGIEHGNEDFRRRIIRRYYTNEEAIKGCELLRKYEVSFSCNNIVGFPFETPKLHEDTVELNRLLKSDTASCSIFTPFHGTPLREIAVQNGWLDPNVIAPTNNDWSVLNMPQFTPAQIAGKARTFNLYVRLPKNRWDEIRLAENVNTTDGDLMFNRLREEVKEIMKDD